jgi:hypothetical protein
MGYQSTLVVTTDFRVEGSEKREAHMYLIVSGERTAIYDPSQPIKLRNGGYIPLFEPISEEQKQSLLSGSSVLVNYAQIKGGDPIRLAYRGPDPLWQVSSSI